MDRIPVSPERIRGPGWLSPSKALGRFNPVSSIRIQGSDESRPLVRYGYCAGTLSFLIPLGIASEVVQQSQPAEIPNGPAWLLGVVNLRGSLVPVFDLARVLGTDEESASGRASDAGRKPVVLVLDKGERAAGFRIDGYPRRLGALRQVPQLPPIPEVLRAHVSGACADDSAIWLDFAFDGLLLEFSART